MDKGHKQTWGDKERARVYERYLAKGLYRTEKSQENINNIAKSQSMKWNGVY